MHVDPSRDAFAGANYVIPMIWAVELVDELMKDDVVVLE